MGAKLVRDNDEQVCRQAGVSGVWFKATDEQAIAALKRKLVEEALEFIETGDPVELWDVQDVLDELFTRCNYANREAAERAWTQHRIKIRNRGMFRYGVMWNPMPDGKDVDG